MKHPLRLSSLAVCALAAACAMPDLTADFATNQILYVDVPFTTKSPGDRELYVAPIDDQRDTVALPVQDKGFPIVYAGDDFWERPVREMLVDVLVRQLQDSQLFGHVVVEQPSAQSLLLKPTLVTFTTGMTEAISGRRTFAEVGIRIEVLGPAAADGSRATLMTQTFGSRQLSQQELNPPSPYRLVGRALQQSMTKLLAGLDGSNLGRSSVPLQAVAVPASAPR